MDCKSHHKGKIEHAGDDRLSAKSVISLTAGKYNDGAGLWLVKTNNDSGKWVLRLTVHGKRREMGLGSINAIPLKEVRQAAEHTGHELA